MRAAALILALTISASAQWTLQQSPTTADLRGIDNVGHGVAWASGTNGTVLRTTDSGAHWHLCTIPPNADHLDFRGIQAFDANTAIVMSSGPGDQSRLYKTTDGCQTWTLLFTNPDKTGFFDAIALSRRAPRRKSGMLLGDPVDGRFALWEVGKYGVGAVQHRPLARKNEACFAASNSSMLVWDPLNDFSIATGGSGGSRFIRFVRHGVDELSWESYPSSDVPVGNHTDSSGIFSIALDLGRIRRPNDPQLYGSGKLVAVGGDYLKPYESTRTAAFTTNGGKTWQAAITQPHGYRSAVAYDPTTNTWITVGPNGTDISTDDGRNWRPLHPSNNDAPDADRNWNALSLPYVVGPHGRIGRLDPNALKPSPSP